MATSDAVMIMICLTMFSAIADGKLYLYLFIRYFSSVMEGLIQQFNGICQNIAAWNVKSQTQPNLKPIYHKAYNSSVIAEMGDRLATIDMGQKGGVRLLCPSPCV